MTKTHEITILSQSDANDNSFTIEGGSRQNTHSAVWRTFSGYFVWMIMMKEGLTTTSAIKRCFVLACMFTSE